MRLILSIRLNCRKKNSTAAISRRLWNWKFWNRAIRQIKRFCMRFMELLVETVTSRKKFLRICGEEKPKEVVKSRLMKLDSSHIQYILECLKENSTQIRNIKQYLLATLYNAPVTVDSYYSAQVRHEFGWGGRVDKN